MQKHRLILIDFEELEANAIRDFLINLGDFDAKMIDSQDFRIQDFPIAPDLLIINGTDNFDQCPDIPKLFVGNSKAENAIKKPFHLNIFEAKIRTILRNKENLELRNLEIKGLKFNQSNHSLINYRGEEAKLTDKETDILLYLSRLKTPASRDELLREVWQYKDGVTTHTLETHIYRLRQKLAQLLDNKDVLLTDEGGYYLEK